MKKFLLSAAALMAAMTMNAQEVCVFNADNAMGLDADNGTALTAGQVLGETESIVAKVGADDTYKPQSATFAINGQEITGGLQGATNPKDADGGVPATTLVQPAGGAFLVFEAKADGFLYVMHKASSNKAYTVFEEGVAISYTFTAIGSADSDLGAVYSYTLPYVVENEQFVVKESVGWAEQEYLKVAAPDKYAARWSKNDEGADVWDPIKINGLGVIKFPVYKDCKYIVNANGSKITAAGFAFSPTDGFSITADGVELNAGGNSQGGTTIVGEKDWTGGFEGDYPMWAQFADGQEGNVASDPEGVAITVGTQTGELWQPQVQVMQGLTLEEDHSYVVKVTAKFPSNGTLQINMGNWGGRDQYTVDVESTGDFQEVEVEFPDYAYVVEGDGFVLFQCGDFKGTTIVKKIQVIDVTGGDTPEPPVEEHVYSVIGTIVGNWDVDTDMEAGDEGDVYAAYFDNVAAGSYEFKIRQDHSWDVNWGSDFKQDGPNCKVEVAEDGSTIWVAFKPSTGEIEWKVEGPAPAGEAVLVASKDWAGGFEGDYPMWAQFADGQEGNVASDAEGVAITVGTQTGELWQPQVQILNEGLTLEEDHSYVVKVTAKFPSNGTLQINMGNWGGRDQYTTDVEATGDFQEVEVEFPDYAYVVEGDGFVLFQCGDFKGTTIVKKVEVWDVTNGPINAIKAVKTITPANGAIYNLAGQKVDASYKGIVIMNGKKYLQK